MAGLSVLLPGRERPGSFAAPIPFPGPDPADFRRTVAAAAAGLVLIAGVMYLGPIPGPTGVLLVALACAAGGIVIYSPLVTTVLLLLASFFRLAIDLDALPAEPMSLLFVALVGSAAVACLRGTIRFRFGPLEAVMVAYLLWNVVSAVSPHVLPAVAPRTGESIVLYRFILMGTVFPFVGYAVGRAVFRSAFRVRLLVFSLLGFAGYSAAVSILQFTGPKALVWPRYIVDAPSWPDRAVGVFDQPVVNGLVMSAGFVAAVLLARDPTLAVWQRALSGLVAPMCVVGVYLTHTRAVLLVFGIALVVCAVIARGARRVFVAALIAAGVFLAAQWATITSVDRESGGLGSPSEIHDRLNMIRTSFWAIGEKPIAGWGIGRFAQVNTHHHKQWAADISWQRGYGYSSHENELGIAVELGLIGLALWLAVLVLLARHVIRAFRRLPPEGVHGRVIGVIAVVALLTWAGTGVSVDLRYNDFANLLVFLLAGAAVGASIGDPGSPGSRQPTEQRDGAPA